MSEVQPSTGTPLRISWSLHYFAVIALSIAIGILFIREPGFGDEITYWSLAFDLHETGAATWNVNSFHDLRWPIWGLIWLWQAVFGAGLGSYYFVPIFYLTASAVLVFTFGRLVLGSVRGAWICALALLFAPVLDPIINRPMPDLSESFFAGCTVLAWWMMMRAETTRRAWIYGALSGLSIGLAYSNRVSGVLIPPILAVTTLVFYRARWKWLLVPAAFSILYLLAECAVYYHVCGDWLHSFHANLGGAGAKDADAMPAWKLPVRYLSGFVHGNRFATIYALLACFGIWAGWRRWAMAGRLVVVWAVYSYFEYSCAVQSLHPIRPLIGSALRYLAALAVPMSLLAAFGVLELVRLITLLPWPPARRFVPALSRFPFLMGVLSLALLIAFANRQFFDLGFARDLRRHLDELPTGTKIFSHEGMYTLACLAGGDAARRLRWNAPREILARDEKLERLAAEADEFWYMHKLVWLSQRKQIERRGAEAPPTLGSYFATPERDWILKDVLGGQDDADIVLSHRRPAGAPAARRFEADAGEFRSLLPALPVNWKSGAGSRNKTFQWPVPAAFRGKLIQIHLNGEADHPEPVAIRLKFTGGGAAPTDYSLRPVGHSEGGADFFALAIPATADACEIDITFNARTKTAKLSGFAVSFDDQR